MKITLALSLCLGLAVLLAACDGGTAVAPKLTEAERVLEAGPVDANDLTADERAILKELGLSASKTSAFTRAPVYAIDGMRPVGTSMLVRARHGVYAFLRTSGLDPGTAVTMWLVLFNNPENCTGDAGPLGNVCDSPDLLDPATGADLVYGDGKVVPAPSPFHASWRDAYYFAYLPLDETSGSVMPALMGAPAQGLVDAEAAEVHLVLRTHGRAIAGMEDAMTGTFAGGCEGFSEDLGTPGPNTCRNLQFAAYQPQGITVDRTEAEVFQPAGAAGGGVLEPGTVFPPTQGSHSTLRRGDDWVSYNLHTTGLPAGAYTNWWVIFNEPGACVDGCDVEDLFNPGADGSVFWATGSIVQQNGVGNFRAKIREGEANSGPGQFVLGNPAGLVNAAGAEIHIIIKYHGPASDDPDVLYDQTHTLLGSCEVNANAWDLGPPFGVQCFDPQFAAHLP